MKGSLVALLVLLACSSSVSGTLYALVSGGAGSQIVFSTVAVDTATGNWSDPIVDNFIYLFFSLTFDGISTFDMVNSIYYYVTGWPAAFVYASDLANQRLLPPIYVGSDDVTEIAYDHATEQLFVAAQFGNDTVIVNVSYTNNMPSNFVFNYTEQGILFSFAHTIDSTNGMYYIVFFSMEAQLMIGQFPTTDPSKFTSAELNCDGVYPEYIAYDAKLEKFVGIGSSNDQVYFYFEIVNGKCWTKPFLIIEPGFMDMTYDPSVTTIYISYFCLEGDFLGLFDVVQHNFSTIPMEVVSDLESSYSIV